MVAQGAALPPNTLVDCLSGISHVLQCLCGFSGILPLSKNIQLDNAKLPLGVNVGVHGAL